VTKRKSTFPVELYVYREPDGEDSFLMQYDELVDAVENAGDAPVATYQLVSEAKYAIDKTVTELSSS
jgi:hypothetical protein